MQRLLALILLASLILLSACKEDTASSEQATNIPADQIAATVNGTVISKTDVAKFKELKGNAHIPDENIIDEMVATELLRQEAIKAGIADKESVRFQIRLQESETLARMLMREKFGSLSFTEADLKSAYDKQMSKTDGREFKARHILLKTEDEANAVIEAIRAGGNFIELAKERSTGPTGPNGGDLGWFEPSRMVPPFAEAVKAMNKGDVSVAPVQTNFGWHVIQLDDVRELPKPDFDGMRDELQQSLIRDAINSYIEEIEGAAEIVKS